MSPAKSILTTSTITLLIYLSSGIIQQAHGNMDKLFGGFYAGPGVTGGEILRARGYLAEEQYVTTSDGYILQLTRGTNPLINQGKSGLANRVPILFIHGVLANSNMFVINSFGASPSDLSGFDANHMIDELKYKPSAKSLPLLAMDFGHEIWILAKRGAPGSQRRILNGIIGPDGSGSSAVREQLLSQTMNSTNKLMDEAAAMMLDDIESILNSTLLANNQTKLRASSLVENLLSPIKTYAASLATLLDNDNLASQALFSFDKRFWNFSLDEQAKYDVPAVIDYILEETNRSQLAVVTHSAGSSAILMALSMDTKLANKLSRAIFWSQALDVGHGDISNLLAVLVPILKVYVGSIPPAFLSTKIQAVLGIICSNPISRLILCNPIQDLLIGLSKNMEPLYPEFIDSTFYPTSSHEFAQIVESVLQGGVLHKFDYGFKGNLVAYNQPIPPIYDARKINLERMSFYVGATDFVVAPLDVETTIKILTVPYKYHLIKAKFNHQGYFWHDEAAELVIIPTLREIQNAS